MDLLCDEPAWPNWPRAGGTPKPKPALVTGWCWDLCLKCKGSGYFSRQRAIENCKPIPASSWVKCPNCHGTGAVKSEK